jgi:hypothetical protein
MSGTQNWSRAAAHLAQHLPPLGAGIDRQPNARQVDPAALARRRLAARRGGRAVGGDRPKPLAFAHQQRRVVGGQRERIGLVHQRLGAQRRELERLEPPGRFLVPAPSVRAGDRHHRPHDLAARDTRELAEAVLRNRESRDAMAMPSRPTWTDSASDFA